MFLFFFVNGFPDCLTRIKVSISYIREDPNQTMRIKQIISNILQAQLRRIQVLPVNDFVGKKVESFPKYQDFFLLIFDSSECTFQYPLPCVIHIFITTRNTSAAAGLSQTAKLPSQRGRCGWYIAMLLLLTSKSLMGCMWLSAAQSGALSRANLLPIFDWSLCIFAISYAICQTHCYTVITQLI